MKVTSYSTLRGRTKTGQGPRQGKVGKVVLNLAEATGVGPKRGTVGLRTGQCGEKLRQGKVGVRQGKVAKTGEGGEGRRQGKDENREGLRRNKVV